MAPEESQEGAGGHEDEAPGQEGEQADGHASAVDAGDGQQFGGQLDHEAGGQAEDDQEQGESNG